MANRVNLGDLEIDAFKVGDSDCKVYLGDILLYPNVETRVVAKFNVTSTSNPTRIASGTTSFSKIVVDDVEQQSVTTGYTFSTTGEHTVKYTLTDPTSIGESTFRNCSGLTSIEIPSGVTSIGGSAFYNCSSLASIVCNATTAPTIQPTTFLSVKTGGTLTVPSGSSGYDTWMSSSSYYLGYYNWTKYEYVEIGGVKWATMNVGATGVTDTGLYFQWGDTQGYTASQVGSGTGQKYFAWTDYKYGNGTSSPSATGMTKYNASDGKTVLEASDDTTTTNWGGSWRMPTTAEFQALGAAVNTAWTADYQGSGVAGMICTDKNDSSKVLFFPACGICSSGNVLLVGSEGRYWSSSLRSSNVLYALHLNFYDGYVGWQGNSGRSIGFPVRGVIG